MSVNRCGRVIQGKIYSVLQIEAWPRTDQANVLACQHIAKKDAVRNPTLDDEERHRDDGGVHFPQTQFR